MTRKVADEIVGEIIRLYEIERRTIKEISVIVSLSSHCVCGKLKEAGFKLINHGKFERKYNINHDFFNKIDTEEKAYLLGFLYADGYNNEEKGVISISLQERDREILEKFKILLESEYPLYKAEYYDRPNNQIQYALTVRSRQISKKLAELGCWQKKSSNLLFPTEEQVPKHLINHFLRGMWDGDGGIRKCYIKSKKHKRLCGRMMVSCVLTSTEEFCSSVNKLLKESIGINSNYYLQRNNTANTWNLAVQGNIQIKKFLIWLYNDSTIWLNRKYETYIEIIKIFEEKNLGVSV